MVVLVLFVQQSKLVQQNLIELIHLDYEWKEYFDNLERNEINIIKKNKYLHLITTFSASDSSAAAGAGGGGAGAGGGGTGNVYVSVFKFCFIYTISFWTENKV